MTKYKIYLFRHGQTHFNEKKIFTGWKDSRLTKNGIKSAKIIAKKLKDKKIDIAFQTQLSRSKDTLKEVLKFHPECREIITANRMIERDYGVIAGISHKTFINRVGSQIYDLKKYGDAIENLSPKDKRIIIKFFGTKTYDVIHRGYDTPPPGGESFAMVEKRVAIFIKNLIKFIKKEHVNVAISAHGNSIRVFRKIMENRTKKEASSWNIPYDKYYTYSIEV